jgi:glycerol-3-phosphate dehydrogenase
MNRSNNLQRLQQETFDICIIGGGASGAGCALDAALRGFKVALIEKQDFAAETSSKSTKLIHGGVRYLEQAFMNLDFGQLRQVKHGLEERQIVLQNAPHLARPLPLLTPVSHWWEGMYYAIGLRIYDFFAKGDYLPKSRWLSKKETLLRMPTLDPAKLHSAVLYFDGQLDDARYCLALAHSADEAGVAVVNHAELVDFEKDATGKLTAAHVKDLLDTDTQVTIRAKWFLNCTGATADLVRKKANPSLKSRIRPSKGVHVVLPMEVLKSEDAMLIPKTPDGRVVFVIPFEGQTLLGTTDTEYNTLTEEPILDDKEVDFLLDTLEPYMMERPNRGLVKAGFGGLRPLIAADEKAATKKLVRDHEVEQDETSGLLSLLGGKWTTYRLMAQDTIDKICELTGENRDCKTANYALAGGAGFAFEQWTNLQKDYRLAKDIAKNLMRKYGSRAVKVAALTQENPTWGERLVEAYPFIKAEVIYQVREEMACTPRDVLARRTRLEIMDWDATQEALPVVVALMAAELGWSDVQQQKELAVYQQLLETFKNNTMEHG